MRINEIFYSLQGEGRWTGTPCVFVRFSGCNLKCPFCDTEHEPYKDFSVEDILQEIQKYAARHIVLTGGEPTLQITEEFMKTLLRNGYYIHVETNGTRNNDALRYAQFVTCSPKNGYCKHADVALKRIDELKVVYDSNPEEIDQYDKYDAGCYYLQPCDTGDADKNRRNIQGAVEYCLKHPKWQLSLQTQKILNVR